MCSAHSFQESSDNRDVDDDVIRVINEVNYLIQICDKSKIDIFEKSCVHILIY